MMLNPTALLLSLAFSLQLASTSATATPQAITTPPNGNTTVADRIPGEPIPGINLYLDPIYYIPRLRLNLETTRDLLENFATELHQIAGWLTSPRALGNDAVSISIEPVLNQPIRISIADAREVVDALDDYVARWGAAVLRYNVVHPTGGTVAVGDLTKPYRGTRGVKKLGSVGVS